MNLDWAGKHNTDLCVEYVFKEVEWNGALKFSFSFNFNFISRRSCSKKTWITVFLQLSWYASIPNSNESVFSHRNE